MTVKEDLALRKMEYLRVFIPYRLTRLVQKTPTAMAIEYLLLCVRTFCILVRALIIGFQLVGCSGLSRPISSCRSFP